MVNSVPISQREVLLQTNRRDIRVTRKACGSAWSWQSNKTVSFISRLFRRLTSRNQFTASDLIFHRARSNFRVQQRLKNFQINLSPRFEHAFQKNEIFLRTEQYAQKRMLTMVHIQQFPKLKFSLKTPKSGLQLAPTFNQTNDGTAPARRASSDLELRRRTPVRFAPVEMVAQQAHRSSNSVKPQQPLERSTFLPESFKEEPRNTRALMESINIKQLTDQVVEALDRRVLAAHERMARR
jgi:hypothetical protein